MLKKHIYKLDIDKVTAVSAAQQLTRQLLAPVTMTFIILYMSPKEQGLYYAFLNFVLVYQVLDLGIGFNLLRKLSSVSYKKLSENDDKVFSNEVIKYTKISIYWYRSIFAISLIFVAPLGGLFLNYGSNYELSEWLPAWLLMIGFSSYSITFTPYNIILEGLGERYIAYRAKLISGLCAAIALLVGLFFGAALYAMALSQLSSCIILYFLSKKKVSELYPQIIANKADVEFRAILDYIKDNFRLAISWSTSFLYNSILPLMLYKIYGPEKYGQYGMTVSVANLVTTLVLANVRTKLSLYSREMSSRNFQEAYKKFEYQILTALLSVGIIGALLTIALNSPYLIIYKQRMLATEMFIICIGYIVVNGFTGIIADFTRLQGGEPFFALSVSFNLLIPVIATLLSIYYESEISTYTFLLASSIMWFLWGIKIYMIKKDATY